ncbi:MULTISPECIES: hypothetical protein [Rhodococcus]|uniref:Uncharacterized protein n=1 Tax=Rhodococcus pseudokoreensis TaxID=2811421 RepID=A0A974VXX6_9NOCA|nr:MULTISPECIES: hypothetical protein [Rhodococcus]MBV6762933.1 hypothetical protein [Rhodococcus opacus]QSE87673.1 hypothetical protein JWS13_03220 [Rhodococcus pseudokoreensis]
MVAPKKVVAVRRASTAARCPRTSCRNGDEDGDRVAAGPGSQCAIKRIADQSDVHPEGQRTWMRQG